jgi:hypothetical protein
MKAQLCALFLILVSPVFIGGCVSLSQLGDEPIIAADTAPAPNNTPAYSALREEVERKIAQLDSLISRPQPVVEVPVQSVRLQQPRPVNPIPQEEKRVNWNYAVVYQFDTADPWNQVWQELEEQEVVDKWRGQRGTEKRFFIYVGTYAGLGMAERRAQHLAQMVGQAPEVRPRKLRQTRAQVIGQHRTTPALAVGS